MVHGIIMAGGSGTRFWPLSTRSKPKQFLSLMNEHSLLENTIDRLKLFCDALVIVGNVEHRQFLEPFETNDDFIRVLYEPCAKNTAPCIGWACHEILKQDPSAQLMIAAADHHINDSLSFETIARKALNYVASEPCIVTIGIETTMPHTGYGYIEINDHNATFHSVCNFHEKPIKDVAERYHQSSRFFWNSGMFIVKAQVLMDLFQTYLPLHYNLLKQLDQSADIHDVFNQFESISIDHGIMERCKDEICMIKSTFDWDDLGSWNSLAKYLKKDSQNNAYDATLFATNAESNTVVSQTNKPIILLDVDNLLVVETADSIMITKIESDQNIKHVLNHLPDHLV